MTALAPTALEAETLAKTALLAGPPARAGCSRARGGLLVHAGGDVERDRRAGMTRARTPLEYGWWLASRAAGIVALLCITLSVAVGLAMAGRVSRDRGSPAR